MNGLISLTFSGFPLGYCYPGDPSTFASDLLNATTVVFNTSTGNFYYNIGASVPSVDNRVYPWYRTGTNDGFEGWYWYGTTTGGFTGWLQPHSTPASGNERRLWVGTTVELQTYDGGEAVAVDDAHGPFWEVDTDFAGRIPMGPGTTANGTVVTVATNFGADDFTLIVDNIPAHYHLINIDGDDQTGTMPAATDTSGHMRVGAGTEIDWYAGVGPKSETGKTYNQVNVLTTVTPVDFIPLVRGTYVIKRTARVYRLIV